jgi:hypothetical protein
MAPKKQPQDRRTRRAPFDFVVDGKTYALTQPTFGAMSDLAEAENETKGVIALLASCASAQGLAAIRSLDAQDVNDLFTDWMASLGGGEAGKSSGSSD